MSANGLKKLRAKRIQVISLVISIFLLIGWNLIWLSTIQDSDGFHLMFGWGILGDFSISVDIGFIPLLPLFILLAILLGILYQQKEEAEPPLVPKLDSSDIVRVAGMTVLIVGALVMIPQLSGLGPEPTPNADMLSTSEVFTHVFGMIGILVPLFVIGLMFKTYQQQSRLENSQGKTDSFEEE